MTHERMTDLARRFGTPLYVFDADAFAARTAAVASALGPEIGLCYSIKANSFLLGCLPEQVSRLEVCSPGELEICSRLGIDPAAIIFSGVNKTEASITRALDANVGTLTAESLEQLNLISRLSSQRGLTSSVLLRLTAGDQFGMDEADLRRAVETRAAYPGARFAGIHFFSGTQKTKVKKIEKELDDLSRLFLELEAVYGWRPEALEYGTGLFADYFGSDPEASELELLRQAAPALREAGAHVRLTVEMGRFLASPCGTYLTAVNDVKLNQGVRYVILDGGSHQLHYDGQVMGMRQPPVEVLNAEGPDSACTLCGSLCATSDRLAQNILLPDLRPGSLVAFSRVGAYSVMEGTALFLSRELPGVVLYSQASGPRLVREAFSTDSWNCPTP